MVNSTTQILILVTFALLLVKIVESQEPIVLVVYQTSNYKIISAFKDVLKDRL